MADAWPSSGWLWKRWSPPARAEWLGTTGIEVASQRPYYDDLAKVLTKIDVGVCWKPGRSWAVEETFRPGTRMLWWWSHGIPVIAYPMAAYVETGHHAGYPPQLTRVRTGADVERALRQLTSAHSRACLQEIALHGADSGSAATSAAEWVAAICHIAGSCRRA